MPESPWVRINYIRVILAGIICHSLYYLEMVTLSNRIRILFEWSLPNCVSMIAIVQLIALPYISKSVNI